MLSARIARLKYMANARHMDLKYNVSGVDEAAYGVRPRRDGRWKYMPELCTTPENCQAAQ
jgi:hypothetical protein